MDFGVILLDIFVIKFRVVRLVYVFRSVVVGFKVILISFKGLGLIWELLGWSYLV